MKIITDFKDFYDYGMSFGVDEAIVYERFQEKIYPPNRIKDREGLIIGFCDEFFELKRLFNDEEGRYSRYHRPSLRDKKLMKELKEDGWVEGTTVMDSYGGTEIDYIYYIRPIDLDKHEWQDKWTWNRKNFSHWKNWMKKLFMEHKVPAFFVDNDRGDYETILNPALKDYGLQKIMDPVEAFQKVSMFIPSLQPEDDFKMTNEQKGKSKGFDEFSFRHKNTKNKPKKF